MADTYIDISGRKQTVEQNQGVLPASGMAYPYGYSNPDEKEKAALIQEGIFDAQREAADIQTGINTLMASSRGARQDFIQNSAKLDGKIASLSPKTDMDTSLGQAAPGSKIAYMADGTQVQIPDTSRPEQYGYSSSPPSSKGTSLIGRTKDKYTEQTNTVSSEINRQLAEAKSFYANFSARQDETTRAVLDAITKKYDSRRAKMEDLNKRMLEGKRIAGISAGRSRYAPGLEAGLLTAEELDGQARLAEIDAQELALIAQAKQARDEASYKVFGNYMTQIKGLNEEKMKNIIDLHRLAIDQDRIIEEKRKNIATEARTKQDAALKMADGIAGSVYDAYKNFTTEAERNTFLEKVGKKYGIDPAVVYSSMLEYKQGTEKKSLDEKNIESQITVREKQIKINRQRKARLLQEESKAGASVKIKDVLSEANALFEYGNSSLGYNARGSDGYVDPNLYLMMFKKIEAEIGQEAAIEFLNEFPPEDNLNPTNANRPDLPAIIKNRFTAI